MTKVKFGSLIKDITRGIRIRASELDKITTYEETDIQYLNVKNVENGLVTGEMPYIKDLDEKNRKYILKNDDLVITKTGYPAKIMVAGQNEGKQYLASGNFYKITIDRQKADPYYLAAYFTSDKGRLVLADISIGEIIPTISMAELNNLELALPPMKEQQKIGQEYRDTVEEIRKLTEQLEKTKEQLNSLI